MKECLTFYDYVENIYKQSIYDKGKTYYSNSKVICPRCKNLITDNYDHTHNLELTKCNSCNLWMESAGNALFVSDSKDELK